MFPVPTLHLAETVLTKAKAKGWTLATAESCTGGLVAAALTDIAGSSAAVDCGYVTYSNAAKVRMLGVTEDTLQAYGAVSEQTAGEMAAGTIKTTAVDLAVSISGIAGPGGGTPDKPVGTVCFGLASKHMPLQTYRMHFEGDRTDIRLAALDYALELLSSALDA